jgi:hypothetical protein
LPPQPPEQPVTVIELALAAEPSAVKPGAHLHAGLVNELGAPFAALQGCRLGKRSWMEKFGDWHHTDVIEGWANGSEAQWSVTALQPARFHLYADYECWAEADYSEFELEVAGRRSTFPAIYTGGGKDLRTRLRHVRLAYLDLPAGAVEVTVRAREVKGKNAIALQRLVLEPVE